MALTQKQLFLSSQLFMSAGKSNLGFDLSRFVSDRAYGNQTLGDLVVAATDPALQALVAQAIMVFMPEDTSAPAQAPMQPVASAPVAAPAARAPEKIDTRYIGRLR